MVQDMAERAEQSPEARQHLLGGLPQLVQMIKGMVDFANETQRIQTEMANTLKDNNAFADGQWPMAQTGIAVR